jgi:hypothetical protein
LQRVHRSQESNLAVLAGVAEREDGVWVMSRPLASLTLRRLLEAGPLDVVSGLVFGLGLLRGLDALRRVGLGQRLDPDNVHVDPTGLTRLEGTWLPAEATAIQTQVGQAAILLCQALGIAERPSETLTAAERQCPALVAVARGLAKGSTAQPRAAEMMLIEAAGGIGAEKPLQRGQEQLAERARSGLDSPRSTDAAPTPPREPMPAQPRPARTPSPEPEGDLAIGPRPTRESTWNARPMPGGERGRPRVSVILAASAAGLIVLLGVLAVIRGSTTGDGLSILGQAPAPKTPRPTRMPAMPAFPAAVGVIKGVQLSFNEGLPCAPGAKSCQLKVEIDTTPLPSDQTLQWNFLVTNLCTGRTVTLDGGDNASVDAKSGWPFAYGISIVPLPAGRRLQIVAHTVQPVEAASPPLVIGESSC